MSAPESKSRPSNIEPGKCAGGRAGAEWGYDLQTGIRAVTGSVGLLRQPASLPYVVTPSAPSAPPGRAPALRESTAAAWLGLLLVFYGCTSMVFSAFMAGSAHVSRTALETALVELELQRAAGAGTQSLHDVTSEVSAQVSALEPVTLLNAGVDGVLGLLLVLGAFGLCYRNALFRRFTQGVVVAKAVFLGVSAWYIHVTYVPALRVLASSLGELLELIDRATGRSGGSAGQGPFASFRAFVNGGLDTTVAWMTVLFVLPMLLALWIVFSRSVRTWCTPASAGRPDAAAQTR